VLSMGDRRRAEDKMDLETRDRLVLENSDLVRSIVYRIGQRLPAHLDRGDLMSVGMIGLLDAATRYRPSTGVPFQAFARRRVHGAIMDSLREMDWVPRSVRALQRRAASAASSLRQQLGREPLREEIATSLGVDDCATDVRHVLYDRPKTDDDVSALEQTPDPTEGMEAVLLRAEVSEQVGMEVARLPERERVIIQAYYAGELTMGQIGASLGVCESRVSQLRSAAVGRLRETLAPIVGARRTIPSIQERKAALHAGRHGTRPLSHTATMRLPMQPAVAVAQAA
jgi:RNA polymerase sigma factor FliA